VSTPPARRDRAPHPPPVPSLIDPLGWWRAGRKVAAWTERQAVDLLRARLFPDGYPPAQVVASPRSEPIERRMQRLLDRALEQSPSGGRLALFEKLLDEIVPDEARIIGALSDGSGSPLVNVRQRSRTGNGSDLVVENVSLIGKTANLTLWARTPTYVGHLLSLGLVEIGPEDPTLKDEYQILLADTAVLQALRAATHGMLPPRVERRTLRLSPLGRDLWAACCPEGGDGP